MQTKGENQSKKAHRQTKSNEKGAEFKSPKQARSREKRRQEAKPAKTKGRLTRHR